MKTFTGKLANGQQYMGVEVPENTASKHCLLENDTLFIHYGSSVREIDFGELKGKILGTYSTSGEIDFGVHPDWVERGQIPYDLYYRDYNKYLKDERCDCISVEDSLLTMFDRDSRNQYPFNSNPHERPADYIFNIYNESTRTEAPLEWDIVHKWRESESQVRPKHWLIILKA